MIEYTNVPCPICKGNLDVKLRPLTHALDWAKGQVIVVNFETQTIRHQCQETT